MWAGHLPSIPSAAGARLLALCQLRALPRTLPCCWPSRYVLPLESRLDREGSSQGSIEKAYCHHARARASRPPLHTLTFPDSTPWCAHSVGAPEICVRDKLPQVSLNEGVGLTGSGQASHKCSTATVARLQSFFPHSVLTVVQQLPMRIRKAFTQVCYIVLPEVHLKHCPQHAKDQAKCTCVRWVWLPAHDTGRPSLLLSYPAFDCFVLAPAVAALA